MTRLQRAFVKLHADLGQLHLRWALIGGLAVSMRGEPRNGHQQIQIQMLASRLQPWFGTS